MKMTLGEKPKLPVEKQETSKPGHATISWGLSAGSWAFISGGIVLLGLLLDWLS